MRHEVKKKSTRTEPSKELDKLAHDVIGAAMAGMVACGLESDLKSAVSLARTAGEVEPRKKLAAVYRRLKPVFRGSYDRLKDVFPRLEGLERG